MSAVLEQYFQHVVVDKINDLISNRFKELKVELDAKFYEFRLDLESLKKNVSDSGQEICEKMQEELKELLAENGKKAVERKEPSPAKSSVSTKKPAGAKKKIVKKAPAKKAATK
ncbi:MAG: hypothetical protein MRK02_08385 [Candidatus Scalindua sp.]|nr:hypothetical protein [Candidatus Scalindua sp.]